MKSPVTSKDVSLNPEAQAGLELAAKGLCSLMDQLALKFQKLKALLHLEKEYLITLKLEEIPSLNREKEKIGNEIKQLESQRLELFKTIENKWKWQEGQATIDFISTLLASNNNWKMKLKEKHTNLKNLSQELNVIIKENRHFIDLSLSTMGRIQKNIIESLQGSRTYGREGKNSNNPIKGLNLHTNA